MNTLAIGMSFVHINQKIISNAKIIHKCKDSHSIHSLSHYMHLQACFQMAKQCKTFEENHINCE